MTEIHANLEAVRARIAGAARSAGRAPEDIALVAVSKTFGAAAVAEAVAAGQLRFGENKVQEAESKIPELAGLAGIASGTAVRVDSGVPDPLRVEWHLVGHLQSNKARRAAELFDVIHSIDSPKLASKLDQAAAELGRTISVLVQVDLAREATKSGIERAGVDALVDAVAACSSLRLDGLMTLPPFFEDPERARPFFRELREIRDRLEARQPGCLGLGHLSMGMSHDFETAISEGATLVRVGTAIFGTRGQQKQEARSQKPE